MFLASALDLDRELVEPASDRAFTGPRDLEGTISLETAIRNPDVVDQKPLLAAWRHLSAVSVEAACLGRPDLFEFAYKDSLLFAAIRTPVKDAVLSRLGLPNYTAVASAGCPISPTDPTAIYDLVDRYHKQLHPPPLSSLDDHHNSSSSSSSNDDPCDTVYEWETIGIVYVTQSPLPNEVHIGLALLPTFRGKGAGIKACAFAVQWAVETIGAHRVQARILSSSPDRARAQRLFAALGFVHEGVQRRAARDAAGAWADVTCMGVVDTDWIVRRRLRAVPRDLWDELFARHQREREELLRWEETQGRLGLRRTSSMETVRGGGEDLALVIPEELSEKSDSGSPSECGTPPTSSSASDCSASPKREGSEPVVEWVRPWSPLSVRKAEDSDSDDRFSDTAEWDMDLMHSSEEPVPRPLSASSWSSFESIGSDASVIAGLREGMSGMPM